MNWIASVRYEWVFIEPQNFLRRSWYIRNFWPEERRSLSHSSMNGSQTRFPFGLFPLKEHHPPMSDERERKRKEDCKLEKVLFVAFHFFPLILFRTSWKMNSLHRKSFDVESILRMPSQSFTSDSTLRQPFDLRARSTSSGSKDLFSKLNQTGKFFPSYTIMHKLTLIITLRWFTRTVHLSISRDKRKWLWQKVPAFENSFHLLSNCSSRKGICPQHVSFPFEKDRDFYLFGTERKAS